MFGTTTRGMWQVTQSFLAMGQGLPGWSREVLFSGVTTWQAMHFSGRSRDAQRAMEETQTVLHRGFSGSFIAPK